MKNINFRIYLMIAAWFFNLILAFVVSDYNLLKEASLFEVLTHNWYLKIIFFASLLFLAIPKLSLLKYMIDSDYMKLDNFFYRASAVVVVLALFLVMVFDNAENIFQYVVLFLAIFMAILNVITYKCFKEKKSVITKASMGFILY